MRDHEIREDGTRREAGEKRQLLKDFSYEFSKGDRVGIVGGNGVGKSTFIKLLAGLQAPTSGDIKIGDTVVIGHYEQQGLDLPGDLTVMDYVINSGALSDGGFTARDLQNYQASGGVTELKSGDGGSAAKVDAFELIKRFGFERSRAFEKIGSLSGGERRRLQLLGVLAKRPNVLLLDEPTNDLDLNTLNVLEQYILEDYDGVLIVVGHDRAFLDAVTSHLFVFEGDGIVRNFEGSFSDFIQFDKDREKERDKEKKRTLTLERQNKDSGSNTATLTATPPNTGQGEAEGGAAEKKPAKMRSPA
jgi:ATP-binding cassette subfamily F protein uup